MPLLDDYPAWKARWYGGGNLLAQFERLLDLLESDLAEEELADAVFQDILTDGTLRDIASLVFAEDPEQVLQETDATASIREELLSAASSLREDEYMRDRFIKIIQPLADTDLAGVNQWQRIEAQHLALLSSNIPCIDISVYTRNEDILFRTQESAEAITDNAAMLLREVQTCYAQFSERHMRLNPYCSWNQMWALIEVVINVKRIGELIGYDLEQIVDHVVDMEF